MKNQISCRRKKYSGEKASPEPARKLVVFLIVSAVVGLIVIRILAVVFVLVVVPVLVVLIVFLILVVLVLIVVLVVIVVCHVT